MSTLSRNYQLVHRLHTRPTLWCCSVPAHPYFSQGRRFSLERTSRPSKGGKHLTTAQPLYRLRCLAHSNLAQTCLTASNMSPLALVAVSVVFLYALWKLVQFARADADLHLLSKGPHHAKAFEGKVVWITGASQGLGEALAQYFAAAGARLIISSRNADKLESVKAQCKTAGSNVAILPFDLCASYEQLEAAASAADSMFNDAGVDFLINNAGASQHALAEETTAAVTDQLFALNTLGPIKLMRAVLPFMLNRKRGRIVVIASMAGKVPSPGQAIYSACKMALYGYFSSLATEVCDRGISVTICCPGPVAAPGPAGAPRSVYGASGLIERNNESSKGRISPARYVQLVANAAAHGVDECWIAKHPVLAIGYIFQLIPRLGWHILKTVGPSRAHALKEGRSGYDVTQIMSSKHS